MASLMKTCRRWYSIVRGDRNSCAATSLFDRPSGHEPCDLQLLRGELVARAGIALARAFAGGAKLHPSSVCPRGGAELLEDFERGTELRPCTDGSTVAVTELVEFPGRPDFLGAPGWESVADYALRWAIKHASRSTAPRGRGRR